MTKEEILVAKPYMVRRYLNSIGVSDHRFDPNTHYHSARLRQMAKDIPLQIVEPDPTDPTAKPKTYEFYKDLADQLDSLHVQFHHHGTGRIVVFTDEEVIQYAHDLAAGTHQVVGGKVVLKSVQQITSQL
jgi:hypothetical protein